MIEYIRGKVAELLPSNAILEVNGIGYDLNISLATYSDISDKQETKLFVYEAIREDAYILYGFSTKKERDLFLLLISVSGVGANTARMILSSLNIEELQNVIASGNVNALKSVKGIGLKTAQRIIVDLKDKIDFSADATAELVAVADDGRNSEAEQALVMLGFQMSAVRKVVEKLVKENPSITIEQIIKQALKQL
ncbi:MAG: Holliday junction branch migration protein RuvA [Paludibacteraceae bacterium]|nr:Holliday junction branch migration protein RuvA [Paludibacteraceae bacterium]